MGQDFKGYYEYLKLELDNYRGSYDEYIFSLPELFKLLCELLNEDIEREYRIMISVALGYFVAPKDIIHEEVYGPEGLIDDIFLCCFVLEQIKNKYGLDFLKEHWDSKQDFEQVFKIAYNESSQVIKEKELTMKILKYVGLK